jgi:hypothetical protein
VGPSRSDEPSGMSRGGGANRPWPGAPAGGDGTRSEPRGCGARLGVRAALWSPVPASGRRGGWRRRVPRGRWRRPPSAGEERLSERREEGEWQCLSLSHRDTRPPLSLSLIARVFFFFGTANEFKPQSPSRRRESRVCNSKMKVPNVRVCRNTITICLISYAKIPLLLDVKLYTR